jgi:hypothetical protein
LCDPYVVVVASGDVISYQTCDYNYTVTRTWSATDDCGNKVTAQQVIYVRDTIAPKFVSTPEPEITVECKKSPYVVPSLFATDNCDQKQFEVKPVVDRKNSDKCDETYNLYISWTAVDACGLSTSFKQVVHVQDTIAPHVGGCPILHQERV